MQAGQQLALAAAVVKPEVERVALWLGPLLAVAWAIASGLGRSAVLKRLDPTLRLVPVTLILLQLLRMAALIAACVGWYRAIRWAADATLNSAPAQPGGLERVGHLPLAGHLCAVGVAELDFFHRPLACDA